MLNYEKANPMLYFASADTTLLQLTTASHAVAGVRAWKYEGVNSIIEAHPTAKVVSIFLLVQQWFFEASWPLAISIFAYFN